MVENTISRLNVLISAQDKASATINRVQGRLSLLSKEGLAMGAANVIPGVSGGTIALITGIFQRIIDAIKSE